MDRTLIHVNLPETLDKLHDYLYANSNIPKPEKLGNEFIKILFCKIYDEKTRKDLFRVKEGESADDTANKLKKLFTNVKDSYTDLFEPDEVLSLDNRSIRTVVMALQDYTLSNISRDIISETFQSFWGKSLRGEKGQFFTPKNVVKMCIDFLEPKDGEKIIDPACGSGSFLIEALLHFNRKSSARNIFGIDKDPDLVKISKTYMTLVGDGKSNLFHEDSLYPEKWGQKTAAAIKDNNFDIVLTNPPFGAKLFIDDDKILKTYKLAHKWINVNERWIITDKIITQVPQILFIERCLQLLKEGGRMAIVLPDGLFGNPRDRYIWQFITENAKVLGVVSLPAEAFLPSTHTKTSVLFLKKYTKTEKRDNKYKIFMAIADKIGHDKNGKIIFKIDNNGKYLLNEKHEKVVDDDVPSITQKYKEFIDNGNLKIRDNLGFIINSDEIKDFIYVPNFYDPTIKKELEELERSGKFKLFTIRQLLDNGVLTIKRGNEIGSKYYGKGDIPFVRTTDIVNWEIKIDPVKSVPEEIYQKYKKLQDVRENDILLVTDGTFLIGNTAMISKYNTKIVLQSHIRKIRCQKPEILNPFVLLYLLNIRIVQKQIKLGTFIQSTLSTLGNRLYDIILPIPVDENKINDITKEVKDIIKLREMAVEKINKISEIM